MSNSPLILLSGQVLGNTLACVCVLLPLGWALGIHWRFGIAGLWLAMSTAWLVATVVYTAIIVNTNWEDQCVIDEAQHEAAVFSYATIAKEDSEEQ